MITKEKIISLRMARQHLINKANQEAYDDLFRDLQPGTNVYWNGFGQPPSLTCRADFDDMLYNRERQINRILRKGRFIGGNLGWVLSEDFELFASVFSKPLTTLNLKQQVIMDLLRQEGPMNIQLMKEFTGLLVKDITPVLHRLQQAFLIYEDQYDGEWDRAWFLMTEAIPGFNRQRYSQSEGLSILIKRFAYRMVWFDHAMIQSNYHLPLKLIKVSIASLVDNHELHPLNDGFVLSKDFDVLEHYVIKPMHFIRAIHRNDILVCANNHWLKQTYRSDTSETLQYMMMDGEFCGAVLGKFRYTINEIHDVIIDLDDEKVITYKDEIIHAILEMNPGGKVLKYRGVTMD